MVGEVLQPPDGGIAIGDPVHVVFERIDDDLTLAQWAVDEGRSAR
jgi:hypothetical protein